LRWLPNGMTILSCEMIVKEWHFWVGLYEKYGQDEFSHETYFQDKIRNIIYHPKRLIIAEQEGIAIMALDGIPGPQGTPGQVILDVDECTFIVGADSWTRFLEKYLRLMESGQVCYDAKSYGQMIPANPDLSMEDLLTNG
jgi:cell wall assembly regulator SMI1